MALTELQLPDRATFYNELQHAASQMNSVMSNWRDIAEFIARIDTADLDTMGVAVGQVRTDLVAFKTVLEEMVAFYFGDTIIRTNIPDDIIDKIRRMK